MNKIILSLVLVTLLTGAYIANQSATPRKESQVVVPRQFLTDAQEQITLTYEFATDMETSETTGDLSHTQENVVHTFSKAKFTPVYDASTHTYTVLVDYDDIQITKMDALLDEEITEYEFETTSDEEIEILYMVKVHADSGKILSMTKTKGAVDEMIDQITKLQISQIFPDIRRAFPHLLGDSILEEETELGKINIHTDFHDSEEGQVLEKFYSDDDIINKEKMDWTNEGGAAVVGFQEELLIQDQVSCIVTRGRSQFDFIYEVDFEEPELKMEENGEVDGETIDSGIDVVGDIEVHYDTQLEVVEQSYKPEYLNHVMEIAEQMETHIEDFEPVDLEIQKSEVQIDDRSDELPEWDGEEEIIPDEELEVEVLQALQSSRPKYSKNYDVVSQKILGKRVVFRVEYRNYGETSNVKGVLMLNSKVLKTLWSYNYKHCGGSKQKNYKKQYNQRLFTVKYPILGIISVQARADFTVDYGFDFRYGGMNQAHGCEITVGPYVKPGITVTGGVSAAVAKGGIYARGTIANTWLNFKSHVKGFIPKLSGNVNLNIVVKPFEFQIGAWYQMFRCQWKKIFRWRPKLRKACGYGSRKEVKVFSHGVGRQKTWTFFNWNWKL